MGNTEWSTVKPRRGDEKVKMTSESKFGILDAFLVRQVYLENWGDTVEGKVSTCAKPIDGQRMKSIMLGWKEGKELMGLGKVGT